MAFFKAICVVKFCIYVVFNIVSLSNVLKLHGLVEQVKNPLKLSVRTLHGIASVDKLHSCLFIS